MPAKGSLGGPATCEPPFVEELQQLVTKIVEDVYVYGDKPTHTTRTHERILRVLHTALKLRRRLRTQDFDVVHLNTSFDLKALLRDLVTIFFVQPYKGNIFLKMHGSDAKLLQTGNPLLHLLMQILFSKVDGIGVLSSEERDNFLQAGLDQHKIFKVKCALKNGVYKRDPAFVAHQGFPEETPVLLYISRFITAKGLIDVVRACRIVADCGYEFALFCVGDGPLRQEAEGEVEKLGLQNHVRFFGYVTEEETDKFYANSSMLLLPTYHFEGFPLVVLHSLAAGIPIITTRIRGSADYLQDPDNCFWAEPKNPEMLALKIIELLTSPKTRAAMTNHNLNLAQAFNAKLIAKDYVAIYNQLSAIKAVKSTKKTRLSMLAALRKI
jgi:glycosyltransferase involved in cell wall biosynthesis